MENDEKCKKCEKFCFFISLWYTSRRYYFSCMKHIFFVLVALFSFSTTFSLSVYAEDAGSSGGIYAPSWKTVTDIRNGNFTMDDIPKIITWVIETLLAIAGTISIVALIYHAVKMQLASGITGDSSWVDKAKAGMKWALLGFALALSAWFLITKFVELLATNT